MMTWIYLPGICGLALGGVMIGVGLTASPYPPAPPDHARLDVEEVYQFDEVAPDRPRPVRAGEDVLIFDFGDEGMVPWNGEAEEWRLP